MAATPTLARICKAPRPRRRSAVPETLLLAAANASGDQREQEDDHNGDERGRTSRQAENDGQARLR